MLLLALSLSAFDGASAQEQNDDTSSKQVEIDLKNIEPPMNVLPEHQLMIEQIEELIAAEEFDEAISSLEKLEDSASERLVQHGSVQRAATIGVQRFLTVGNWVRERTRRLLIAQPQLRDQYVTDNKPRAARVLEELETSSVLSVQRAAQRFASTDAGDELLLLLADLYLEKGWVLAAKETLGFLSPSLKSPIGEPAQEEFLPWSLVWNAAGRDQKPELVESIETQLQTQSVWDHAPRGELLRLALNRLRLASAIEPSLIDGELWKRWEANLEGIESWESNPNTEWAVKGVSRRRSSWSTFAGGNSRNASAEGTFQLDRWPAWSHQALPPFMATTDQTPASRPRVGELQRGTLPYHPVVHKGRVYVNVMTQILAFDLASGKQWPDVIPSVALFDSHMSTSSYLPLGYPLIGSPRATLSVSENSLYARMGSPVTGWANARTSATSSESFLIGLDLEREGAMLEGFPLRLEAPEFGGLNYDGTEFDGPPVVWGDTLIVPIVQRDNVGLRRSVAAFDRVSGSLRWKSKPLATGVVEGSNRANLISHQVLTVAGGRLFYNTNLGSVVCLDPLSGNIVWLSQYARQIGSKQRSPDRFRYRDLNPCLVHKGLVYCAPQDCPEIFALESSTGDLVWSTESTQVPDAIHLLGVHEDSLIVSGDRLTWLNRVTGRMQARFPSANTPGEMNALARPRGLGRGVISDGEVYWPVASEVLVFEAGPASSQDGLMGLPLVRRKIRLGARGTDGGNIVVSNGHMIFASTMRLMAFRKSAATNAANSN